mgnify:CR=1 FL=1
MRGLHRLRPVHLQSTCQEKSLLISRELAEERKAGEDGWEHHLLRRRSKCCAQQRGSGDAVLFQAVRESGLCDAQKARCLRLVPSGTFQGLFEEAFFQLLQRYPFRG